MARLIWWKLRIEAARYRANPITIAVPAGALALAVVTFWAARVVFGALVEIAPAFAEVLLYIVFAMSGLFLSIAGLRWGIQRLFLSSDLEFLLSLPIPVRNVFVMKSLEIVASSPIAAVLLVATTWGYLEARDEPFAIGISLVTALPVIVGAVLPGVLLTLVLVRVLSRSHVRALLAFLPAAVGALFVMLGPVAGGFSRIASGRFDPEQLERVAGSVSPSLRVLPTSWAADIAIGVVSNDAARSMRGAAAVLLAIALVGAVTYAGFRSMFRTAWAQMAEASTRVRRGTLIERLAPPLPGPIRATVIKEWRTFFRDMRTIATTFFPAVVVAYLLVSNAREGDNNGMIFPAFFLIFVVPSIASTALLNERRNITLFKTAPITGFQTLLGKLAAYGVPLAVMILAGSAVLAVLSDRRLIEVILFGVFAVWTLGWVMLTHLAIAGIWARFDVEKPTLPFIPSVAGVVATMFVGTIQILFGLWVAGRAGASVGVLSHAVLGIPLLAATVGSCVAALLVAQAGGRRIDSIDAP